MSEDVAKSRLREAAMKELLSNPHLDYLNDQYVQLFNVLLQSNDTIPIVLNFLAKYHAFPLVSQILDLLFIHFSKNIEAYSSDFTKTLISTVLTCVNIQLPVNVSKLDVNSMNFLESAAHLVSLFINQLHELINPLPVNSHQLALIFLACSYVDDASQFIPTLKPIISTKFTLFSLTYSVTAFTTKHKGLEGAPSIKTTIVTFKSISEKDLFAYSIPLFLSLIQDHLNVTLLKELPSVIYLVTRKIKNESNQIITFCAFINAILGFCEAFPLIRPLSDEIINLLINSVTLTTDIPSDFTDPFTFMVPEVCKCYLNFIQKLDIKPFETLNPSKDVYGVLLLSIYVMSRKPPDTFNAVDVEMFLNQIQSQSLESSPSRFLLIYFSGLCVQHYQSMTGLIILVNGLLQGTQYAFSFLTSNDVSFDFVFPEVVNQFKPEKTNALYIQALQALLQARVPPIPEQESSFETDGSSIYSDSNFESIPDFAKWISSDLDDDELNQAVPTPTTILFCNIISSLGDHPELKPLLSLSASAISFQFSSDLSSGIQMSKHKGTKLELLAAYSHALQSLDIPTLYSLAKTFLLLIPGQPLLFLAISLQRLPHAIINSCLQKTLQYAHTYPDLFGRMVALIAHSHPDIALSFTDSFIQSSLSKRRFFLFKSSESNEDSLIVIFKVIGYCSIFVDTNYFMSDFLPFATGIMNKQLTIHSKLPELFSAALFAIRKLSIRISQFQEQHMEHVLPFKDFLVQFVTSHFIDVGERIIAAVEPKKTELISSITQILSTMASLVPIRPIRAADKYDSVVELTAFMIQYVNHEQFESIITSVELFYNCLLESNPNLFTFITIATPLFPALLTSDEWPIILEMISSLCTKWEKLKIVQATNCVSQVISNFVTLLPCVLPLLIEEKGQLAADIVFVISSLQCAIRNQFLSLPRSIRPALPSEGLTGDSLCKEICTLVSKHFMSSQVFDIITGFLDLFAEQKIGESHHLGAALCVKHLLEERGVEEFRYDQRIIKSIIEISSDKEENVVSVFLDIICLLAKMRLNSVLSTLATQNANNMDKMFDKIIMAILDCENTCVPLLAYVSEVISADEPSQQMIWFSGRILPLLSQIMDSADSETWASLFIGVIQQTQNISSPLFLALYGNEKHETLLDYAMKTANDRPLALPLILNMLPEHSTPFISQLCLAFAAASEETCHAFLEYTTQTPELQYFNEISKVFEQRDSSLWSDLAEQFVSIFIPVIIREDVQKCMLQFAKKIDDDGRMIFWTELIKTAIKYIDGYLDIIAKFVSEVPVDFQPMLPIVPHLIVRPTNKSASLILKKIYEALGGDSEKEDDISFELLKMKDIQSEKSAFLNSLIEVLKAGTNITECVKYITFLCDEVNDDTETAIEALLDQLSNLDESSQSPITDTIKRLLL